MKRLKLFTVALATLLHAALVMAPASHPQENNVIADEQVGAQRLTAAREFLDASDLVDPKRAISLVHLTEQIMDALSEKTETVQLDLELLQHEQQLRAGTREFSKLFLEKISKKLYEKKSELAKLIAPIYARVLTVGELNTLTEFHRSPVGRKFQEACQEILTISLPEILTAMVRDEAISNSGSLNPEKERAINEMLEANQFDCSVELRMDLFARLTQPISSQAGLPGREIKEMNAGSKATLEKFELQRQQVKQHVISVLGKKLELEEIKAITDFYQTAIAQQILQSMPQIVEEMRKIQQKIDAVISSDTDRIIQEMNSKLRSQQ